MDGSFPVVLLDLRQKIHSECQGLQIALEHSFRSHNFEMSLEFQLRSAFGEGSLGVWQEVGEDCRTLRAQENGARRQEQIFFSMW